MMEFTIKLYWVGDLKPLCPSNVLYDLVKLAISYKGIKHITYSAKS